MKSFFAFTLLLLSITAFSQDSKFSLEVNYPIPVGDNFLAENSYGIADIGAKYRFLDVDFMQIGAGVNGGVAIDNGNQNIPGSDFQVTYIFVQPKVFSEFYFESAENFHPIAGIGYTHLIANFSGGTLSGESSSRGGINAVIGLAYDISDTLFLKAVYDYTSLSNEDDIPDSSYGSNVSLVKVGLGFRL